MYVCALSEKPFFNAKCCAASARKRVPHTAWGKRFSPTRRRKYAIVACGGGAAREGWIYIFL